jgi:uncharacterized protein (DUF1330 family)
MDFDSVDAITRMFDSKDYAALVPVETTCRSSDTLPG